MARYVYNQSGVNSTIAELNDSINEIDNVNTLINSGISIIESARGGQYIEINSAATLQYKDVVETAVRKLISDIRSKVALIEEYNSASFLEKAFSTVGMGLSKLIEGFGTAGENILDGFCSLGGLVVGIFSEDAKNSIGEFVGKDHVGDFFKDAYNGGFLTSIEKYSAFSSESTAANIFKGVGIAAGYVATAYATGGVMSLATGGSFATGAAAAANSIGYNTVFAGIGGMGSGTEDALQSGMNFDQAAIQGAKRGAMQAGTAFVAGKASQKIQNVLANRAAAKATVNSADDIASVAAKASGGAADDVAGGVSKVRVSVKPKTGAVNSADDFASVAAKASGGAADDAVSGASRLKGSLAGSVDDLVDDVAGGIDDLIDKGYTLGADGTWHAPTNLKSSDFANIGENISTSSIYKSIDDVAGGIDDLIYKGYTLGADGTWHAPTKLNPYDFENASMIDKFKYSVNNAGKTLGKSARNAFDSIKSTITNSGAKIVDSAKVAGAEASVAAGNVINSAKDITGKVIGAAATATSKAGESIIPANIATIGGMQASYYDGKNPNTNLNLGDNIDMNLGTSTATSIYEPGTVPPVSDTPPNGNDIIPPSQDKPSGGNDVIPPIQSKPSGGSNNIPPSQSKPSGVNDIITPIRNNPSGGNDILSSSSVPPTSILPNTNPSPVENLNTNNNLNTTSENLTGNSPIYGYDGSVLDRYNNSTVDSYNTNNYNTTTNNTTNNYYQNTNPNNSTQNNSSISSNKDTSGGISDAVIPTIIGLGVTGAAGAAGYSIYNKKKKEKEDEEEDE